VRLSAKLGIAALIFMAGSFFAALFMRGDSPLGLVCAVISFVLGFLAARHGSKWWLLLPFVILVTTAFVLVMTWGME
jgi:hypothetical protein